MKNNDFLEVLRNIDKNPNKSQRELAESLGFSLGKFNYILNDLKKKGLIKFKNFKKNPKKLNYIYYLTPKGFTQKTKLTLRYLERMSKEYEQLRKELNKVKNYK